MRKYNLSEIMTEAWKVFKSGAFKDTTFGDCLRLIWKNVKETGRCSFGHKEKKSVNAHVQILSVAKWVLRKMDAETFMALDAAIATNDLTLTRETEKAIEVETEWDGYMKKIWLPKSACEYVF